ncbi:ABC transporter permease [Alteromonas lipolytica]|uniref:ABC transporter permease n=2 Tax=Alteromonas lipolytica TaxID=1856405 RepID=A0A1E8FCG3_9ALTE|nr:ABC transporter permease [Alteromonas lipolytica]
MIRVMSMIAFMLFWQLAVMLFKPDLLPAPLAVMQNLFGHISSGELPHHLAITLRRIAISFVFAMLLGSALGLLMGHFKRFDLWADSLMTLALNVPALVTIILCFIWFGLNETAALIAVIVNKTPNIAVTMREGARAIDKRLLDVAKAYQLPALRTFGKVYLPQLYPYFLAAARGGLALVWKIVLVVELLGCSDGVGFQLSLFFQYFDITSVLAYTLAFACIIFAIEGGILRPWERRVLQWR